MEGGCNVFPWLTEKIMVMLIKACPCIVFVVVPVQITVYDQENFQGKRLEFTSACQNIMECGVDNIRSLKVECGA